MKERISDRISGIHFGHVKACALDDILSGFEESLSNISYISGFSTTSEKKGVNRSNLSTYDSIRILGHFGCTTLK